MVDQETPIDFSERLISAPIKGAQVIEAHHARSPHKVDVSIMASIQRLVEAAAKGQMLP